MLFHERTLKSAWISVAAVFVGISGILAADAVSGPEALKAAPVNTWVQVLQEKTGGRDQPLFVYAPEIKRFVTAAGMQNNGGSSPRHYDAEEFDIAACKWFNAYPPGMEKGRPASGPLDDKYMNERRMHGHNGRQTFYKDGEYIRPAAGGQWSSAKTYGEYCYVPETGKAYLYLHEKTLSYDVAKRTWEDLKAEPRKKCQIWGSMCYDPINKEILHAGGDGGSADISTWVYSIEKNEWRKLEFGSAVFKALFMKAKEVCWQAKDLLGRVSSRFSIAETKEEAKVDLVATAKRLLSSGEALLGELKAAKVADNEKVAAGIAVKRLENVLGAVKAAGPTLTGTMTTDKIDSVRAVRVVFEQVVDALSSEPPGRARSQIAYDAVNKKIVMFGGDGLDRVLSDTWVYDCASRTWEQKFPEKCPKPRAGHILVWLPKAKSIVLAGGYSRTPLAQEIWTYDVKANTWKLLFHAPLKEERYRSYSPNCPNVNTRTYQSGAVNEDDVLVCPEGQTVWACKLDPGKVDEAGTAAQAATSGSYVFNQIDPALWEKAATPDPAKAKKFLDELPMNQWTTFEFPKYAPGARNRWGTSAYDTDRHQFLLWGGGHATSHENDVAHFSVLGGFWTIGFHPDDPIENVYASQPTYLSFHDRVHVPIHAYKGYCYDPTLKMMFYFDRAYNPLVREWEPKPFPGLSHRGPMHSHMERTSRGAVTLSENGLFLFDASAKAWKKLPVTGAKLGSTWCDGASLCYDSKRDCLWSADNKAIVRYDMATGQAEKVSFNKPKDIGSWTFYGEEVYLPEADLILLMNLFKKPDGTFANVAFNPQDNKFYWVSLKYVSGGKPVEMKNNPFSWSDAQRYDPELKLVLLNNSSAGRVWVMKFERPSAKLEEMTVAE